MGRKGGAEGLVYFARSETYVILLIAKTDWTTYSTHNYLHLISKKETTSVYLEPQLQI